jgi:UDP-glucose:glycoprotein glucosyltransferase
VDRVTDPDILASPKSMTDEAMHQFALEVAATHGFLSKSGSLGSLEMNLGLHTATPKIEAFYHHYLTKAADVTCGSWVDWYGEVVCDVKQLSHLAGIDTIDAPNMTVDS